MNKTKNMVECRIDPDLNLFNKIVEELSVFYKKKSSAFYWISRSSQKEKNGFTWGISRKGQNKIWKKENISWETFFKKLKKYLEHCDLTQKEYEKFKNCLHNDDFYPARELRLKKKGYEKVKITKKGYSYQKDGKTIKVPPHDSYVWRLTEDKANLTKKEYEKCLHNDEVKMRVITINLPDKFNDSINKIVEKKDYSSKSELIREILGDFLPKETENLKLIKSIK